MAMNDEKEVGEFTQLVVAIPRATHRRIKLQGFIEGKDMNTIVNEVLDAWLKDLPEVKIGDQVIS